MSSPQTGPDAMLAGFHAQIEAKLRQADELQAATEQLRVTESNPDVSITVDATGNVTDLRVTPTALAKTPEAVSAVILATLRAAQAKVGARVREAVAPVLGGDSETLGMLMSGYADRFGATDAPPARQPRPRDDDDFAQRDSWLRDN